MPVNVLSKEKAAKSAVPVKSVKERALHALVFELIGVLLFAMALLGTVLSLAFTQPGGTLPASMGGLAGLLGAKKAGASRQALVGAAAGTVAGLFLGLVGVLVLPFVGAAAGEYLARRDHRAAVRVGVATGIGLVVAIVAKVVIAFVMVGIFVVALLY